MYYDYLQIHITCDGKYREQLDGNLFLLRNRNPILM